MAGAQVVAHQPDHDVVRLWIDVGHGPGPAELRVVDDDGSPAGVWSPPEPAAGRARRSRFPGRHVWLVEGLRPGSGHRVEDDRGTVLATFRTLPARLPLTVVVGSCYSVDDDRGLPAGQAPPAPYARLQAARRRARQWTQAAWAVVPHPRPRTSDPAGVAERYEALAGELARTGRPVDLKVLLGDQVYVDQPPWTYLRPRRAAGSWALVAARYRATWQRLGPLLSCGANICVSEDHEYWNNYPSVPLWLKAWPRTWRDDLCEAAVAHRRAFQLTERVRTFEVGDGPVVSFFVADTRCRRTEVRAGAGFMDPAPFRELLAWIGALPGPGVVVLGQPLLTAAGDAAVDTTLANYPDQHGPLCRAIGRAEHDVVVLCGDVHFGRLAIVPFDGERRMVEVVSSPMALLAAAGKPAGPPVAPDALEARGQVESRFLARDRPDGSGEDHVTVLAFEAAGDGVSMRVTPYYTRFSHDDGVPRAAADWAPVLLH